MQSNGKFILLIIKVKLFQHKKNNHIIKFKLPIIDGSTHVMFNLVCYYTKIKGYIKSDKYYLMDIKLKNSIFNGKLYQLLL